MDCYDLKVRAKAVGQFYTPYPDDDDPNNITLSWPWFVDLEVTRVIDGQLDDRQISALAVLHSAYGPETQTWLLREHTLGGYNILRLSEPEKSKRCASGEALPDPYLRPSQGDTLESLRERAVVEGEP